MAVKSKVTLNKFHSHSYYSLDEQRRSRRAALLLAVREPRGGAAAAAVRRAGRGLGAAAGTMGVASRGALQEQGRGKRWW